MLLLHAAVRLTEQSIRLLMQTYTPPTQFQRHRVVPHITCTNLHETQTPECGAHTEQLSWPGPAVPTTTAAAAAAAAAVVKKQQQPAPRCS
jgi:hypothetical protein